MKASEREHQQRGAERKGRLAAKVARSEHGEKEYGGPPKKPEIPYPTHLNRISIGQFGTFNPAPSTNDRSWVVESSLY